MILLHRGIRISPGNMATSVYQETSHCFDEKGVYLVSAKVNCPSIKRQPDSPGVIEIAGSDSEGDGSDKPTIVFVGEDNPDSTVDIKPEYVCPPKELDEKIQLTPQDMKFDIQELEDTIDNLSSIVDQLPPPTVVLNLPPLKLETKVDSESKASLYLSSPSTASERSHGSEGTEGKVSLTTFHSQGTTGTGGTVDTIPVDSELIPQNLTQNIHLYQDIIDTAAFQGIWEHVLSLFEIPIEDKMEKYCYLYYELLDLRAIIGFNNENMNEYLKILYQKVIPLPDLSWEYKKALIYRIILKLVSRNNLKFGFASYIAMNQILEFWRSKFSIPRYPPRTTLDISYSYLSHTILEKLILQANFENKRYPDLLTEMIEWVGKIIVALRNYHALDIQLQKLLVSGIFKLWRSHLLENYQPNEKESLVEKKYLDMLETILPSFLDATYELKMEADKKRK